jgi:arylsulfatase
MSTVDKIQRSVLPIPEEKHVGLTTYDAKDPETKFPPIRDIRPPKGAPNVLVILLDDVGFGASSAFGGPVNTPAAERLAKNGLKLNRFHTTALCSPTRPALLTGRNHHSVNMGGICEMATSAPGYTSVLPKDKAPLAMTLKLNGYATAQFGKCHEVPVWQTSPMGPFDSWPSGGGGFEYFYGFIGGEADQYYPGIYEGMIPIEPDKTPEQGYHFTEDMTNKAIGWVRQEKALMADKPFFMYYAPGATHAPHHVPKEWIEKYKGKFDGGWDKLREESFERQKKLGVIPPDAVLTKRPDEIPAYDDMPAELKPILAREMETYAGFLEHTDHQIGRLIDALEDLEVLDDTLIYYIIGDNGASAEGTPNGCFNEIAVLNGMGTIETPEFLMSKIDEFGGPEASNHYAVGWAHAMDTPYQWTKQVASHWGGTRNGTIVHWPNGIQAKDEVRSQFGHVIDIAPTVLEAAGIPAPTIVNSVQQAPFEGVSMLYAFNDAKAAERHETQYFEMFCNRGIYHKGWTAVTRHGVPWVGAYERAFDEELAELQRLFLIEATKYNVLPLDDRSFERFNSDIAGRPQLIKGKSQMLFGGMHRLQEHVIIQTHNKSYSLTAEIEVPESGANGVIVSMGAGIGGWSFYAMDGKLKHCYNFFGIENYFAEGKQAISAGKHQVRMEFTYDGGGLAKGGSVSLFVDGKKDGESRVDMTVPMLFGTDTCDVGKDAGSPVSPDYGPKDNEFSGTVNWVQIDIDENAEDLDHLITPEERYKVAMARQ